MNVSRCIEKIRDKSMGPAAARRHAPHRVMTDPEAMLPRGILDAGSRNPQGDERDSSPLLGVPAALR